MSRRIRTLALIAAIATTIAVSLVLTALPALATEAAGGDEKSKIQLPADPHERVGLILVGLIVLGTAGALWNARKQLRGERGQATGEFRWR